MQSRLASENDKNIAREVYFSSHDNYEEAVKAVADFHHYAVKSVYGMVNRVYNDYVAQGELIAEQLEDGYTGQWIADRMRIDLPALNTLYKRYLVYLKREDRLSELTRMPVPEGYTVKGISSLIDGSGKIKQQWIKTDRNKSDWAELVELAISSIPKKVDSFSYISSDRSTLTLDGLLTLYPVADLHLGLRDTANQYNLKKAVQRYAVAFSKLIRQSPNSKTAIIANLGDFTHLDNLKGVTPAQHNILDSNASYSEIVSAAMQFAVDLINTTVQKHDQVFIIWKAGNHDEATGIVMLEALKHLYLKNPQVQIVDSNEWATYYQFGHNLLGFTHGHTVKLDQLPMLMATDKARAWGDTTNHVWHVGHFHHRIINEIPGCQIEIHRSPSPLDNWSTTKGYRSQRTVQSITYDKDRDVSRITVSV